VSTPSGSGLQGLGDRVAVLDGMFEISSPPNVGTTVRPVLPREQDKTGERWDG
jgi:signal transduction histidine kinase